MKKNILKFPDIKKIIHLSGIKPETMIRIDEEGLFNLFTADIIKMKIKFTR